MEVAPECIPTKLRAKHRVSLETLAVRKKQDYVKTASQTKKPKQCQAQKLNKVRKELINAYQKEQIKYIQG